MSDFEHIDLNKVDGSLVPHLVAMADRNAGAEIEILAANTDILFAVWEDRAEAHGCGILPIKGYDRLLNRESRQTKVSAIKCRDLLEACVLGQALGTWERVH
jgi:hypothetical protein